MKIKQKIKYFLDNYITRGTANLMLLLFIVVMSIIAILTLGAFAVDGFEGSYLQLLWQFVNLTFDAGNLMGFEDGKSALFLTFGLIVTLLGILVLSLVISFVSSGFETRLSEIAKGRGQIIEKNHTLILGFDNTVPIMIEELIIANENIKRGLIVILSELIPEEVFAILGQTIKDYKNTKVIVRSGNLNLVEDLEMVAIQDAKSIIIAAKSDIETIKNLITIKQSSFITNKKTHIITQVFDPKNLEIIKKLLPEQVETVYVHDLKARIFARTCIQPGSSMIYKDLFSFDGSEIYFEALKGELTKFVDLTFSEAVLKVNNGYLIGLSRNGKQLVNPSPATRIKSDDELIVIAEDDGKITYQDHSKLTQKIVKTKSKDIANALNLVIIGFSKGLLTVLSEIDAYPIKKGKLLILVESESDKKQLLKIYQKSTFDSFQVIVGAGNNRDDLARIPLENYDVACIFANNYSTDKSDDALDADTLLTILHLHDLEQQRNLKLNLVTEILNENNVTTFQSINVDDFMISNLLLSRIITQISENIKTNDVITDLISEDGSELYLKFASDYVPLNQEVNCFTVLNEANKKKHLFIGYKLYKKPPVINPKIDTNLKFGPKDAIIVVAED
jgi:Trk K+ transport system NAD-binding subunit